MRQVVNECDKLSINVSSRPSPPQLDKCIFLRGGLQDLAARALGVSLCPAVMHGSLACVTSSNGRESAKSSLQKSLWTNDRKQSVTW